MPQNQNQGLCWVLNLHKLVFLHIARCATTSIRESANYVLGNMAQVPDDYFVFTVLRHPYRRFASAYEEALKRTDLAADLLPIPDTEKDVHDAIDILNTGIYEPHFAPQHSFMVNPTGGLYRVHKYIWFPTLQKELLEMYDERRINASTFQHRNKSANGVKDSIMDMIRESPKLRKRLKAMYNEDEMLIKRVLPDVNSNFFSW